MNGPPPRSVTGKVGSLGAFWPLLEPVLDALAPRRVCEVGVENGAFAAQLLDWCRARGCDYAGVDPAPPDDVPGVIRGASLDLLPRLERCDAYFIDGDHNYYTVRGELDAIARGAALHGGRAPLICVHDVGWPWGRRDMYYAPETIPAEHRHPLSAELGVALHSDELVDGGFRDPGRYAIALRAGGPRNGVLTAIEDFLAESREADGGWRMVLVPAAFGLAVLYRDGAVPELCARRLRRLETGVAELAGFLQLVERNFMSLYLFGEDAKRYAEGLQRHADGLQLQFTALETAYGDLLAQFNGLQRAYADLSTHADTLLDDYRRLDETYRRLQNDRAG